jgi:hypothetical protein
MAPDIKPFHSVHLFSLNSFALLIAMVVPTDFEQGVMLYRLDFVR